MLDKSQGTSCPDPVSRFGGRVAPHPRSRTQLEMVWRRLAPLIAARRSMRICDDTGKFATARTLATRLPASPAAVPLYASGRAVVLALDFDSKGTTPAAVDADVDRVLGWIRESGGRAVTDRSTSGGRHVLIPLAHSTPIEVADIRMLMNLLSERLTTLDPTPMLNAATGCITPPASACREGGHRLLDCTLDEAVDTFAVRSAPGFVAKLTATLGGASDHHRQSSIVRTVAASLSCGDRIVGVGDDKRRLHPLYCQSSPIPPSVAAFAAGGKIDRQRWRTHSEARQSVITHAVLRGSCLADIRSLIDTPEWAGVRSAYERYGRAFEDSLSRDVTKALTWSAQVAEQFRQPTHKQRLTGGIGSSSETRPHRRWLCHARRWAQQEFSGQRVCGTVLVVLQALAYSAVTAGSITQGVPTLAVGGRSLSHAAGLISETAVWNVLRLLREREGSPLLLTYPGSGKEADRYALTTPKGVPQPTRSAIEHTTIEMVHPAWRVLGLGAKRVHDFVEANPNLRVQQVIAELGLPQSTGYDVVASLRVAGLLTVENTLLVKGPTDLDSIAAAHGLEHIKRERIIRHRAERIVWHFWLENHFGYAHADRTTGDATLSAVVEQADLPQYWQAIMTAGPPPR